MNHFLRLTLLFLSTLAFPGQAQADAMRVVTHALTDTRLSSELELSGTLRSIRESEVSVAADALVSAIHVDVGSKVKRGELLLELDQNIVTQEHQRALAQLSAAETTARETRRLRDEALKLRQQNHISQSDAEARESGARLAQAQLEEARAEAKIAAENLARHRLHAPFDGVISGRWTELGQWLNRGDRVFTLVSLEELRLDVRLPQEHLSSLEQLSEAHIRPDTRPELEIAARIESLVPVGDQSRSVLLRLAANEPSDALFPGASARALLHFEHAQTAIVVPRDAILRNPDGNHSVFVVEEGKARVRQIVLGRLGGDGYMVEQGLSLGEAVVVRGNEVLSDGQPVTVIEQTSTSTD